MKFVKLIAIMILVVSIIQFSAKEVETEEKKKKASQSQFGRNYRKPYPTPGSNPLPKQYFTGPITNYAQITPQKYRKYNKYIANENGHLATSGANARRARGLPVFYHEDGDEHDSAKLNPLEKKAVRKVKVVKANKKANKKSNKKAKKETKKEAKKETKKEAKKEKKTKVIQ